MKPAEADRLRITEVFHSLQGEGRLVGLPTVFIRLTGCPLRCRYCDTEYAFKGGEWRYIEPLLQEVSGYATPYVTVTGGEPLAQGNCLLLLRKLCDAGYQVSLETSGAMDVGDVDPRVIKVMDVKTPGSGESERNLLANLQYLQTADQLKFVLCDRDDYQWSRSFIERHGLEGRCELLFSPSYGQLDATTLAEWVLADRLPVRFQLQLHKQLWGETAGK